MTILSKYKYLKYVYNVLTTVEPSVRNFELPGFKFFDLLKNFANWKEKIKTGNQGQGLMCSVVVWRGNSRRDGGNVQGKIGHVFKKLKNFDFVDFDQIQESILNFSGKSWKVLTFNRWARTIISVVRQHKNGINRPQNPHNK